MGLRRLLLLALLPFIVAFPLRPLSGAGARAQLRSGAGCGVVRAVPLLRGLARAFAYQFVPSSRDLRNRRASERWNDVHRQLVQDGC